LICFYLFVVDLRLLYLLFDHGRLSHPTCGILLRHFDIIVTADLVRFQLHVIDVGWSLIIIMLGILLLFDQLGINTIRVVPQQRVVVADLCQFALIQHYNLVCVPYRRQSVGNDDSSYCTELFSDSINGGLHLDFVLLIEC
jgi:hypothetical protein